MTTGPIANIGVSGDSSYTPPNYAPLAQGLGMFGRGLGQWQLNRRKRQEQEAYHKALSGFGQAARGGWDSGLGWLWDNMQYAATPEVTKGMQYLGLNQERNAAMGGGGRGAGSRGGPKNFVHQYTGEYRSALPGTPEYDRLVADRNWVFGGNFKFEDPNAAGAGGAGKAPKADPTVWRHPTEGVKVIFEEEPGAAQAAAAAGYFPTKESPFAQYIAPIGGGEHRIVTVLKGGPEAKAHQRGGHQELTDANREVVYQMWKDNQVGKELTANTDKMHEVFNRYLALRQPSTIGPMTDEDRQRRRWQADGLLEQAQYLAMRGKNAWRNGIPERVEEKMGNARSVRQYINQYLRVLEKHGITEDHVPGQFLQALDAHREKEIGQVHNALVDALKAMKGMGANFTPMEKRIIDYIIGSESDTVWGSMWHGDAIGYEMLHNLDRMIVQEMLHQYGPHSLPFLGEWSGLTPEERPKFGQGLRERVKNKMAEWMTLFPIKKDAKENSTTPVKQAQANPYVVGGATDPNRIAAGQTVPPQTVEAGNGSLLSGTGTTPERMQAEVAAQNDRNANAGTVVTTVGPQQFRLPVYREAWQAATADPDIPVDDILEILEAGTPVGGRLTDTINEFQRTIADFNPDLFTRINKRLAEIVKAAREKGELPPEENQNNVGAAGAGILTNQALKNAPPEHYEWLNWSP